MKISVISDVFTFSAEMSTIMRNSLVIFLAGGFGGWSSLDFFS